MPGTHKPTSKPQTGAADTEHLFFMLNCYDVWSATPRQGCDAREAAEPATQPAEAATV